MLTLWYVIGATASIFWLLAVLFGEADRELLLGGVVWIVSAINITRYEIREAINSMQGERKATDEVPRVQWNRTGSSSLVQIPKH